MTVGFYSEEEPVVLNLAKRLQINSLNTKSLLAMVPLVGFWGLGVSRAGGEVLGAWGLGSFSSLA